MYNVGQLVTDYNNFLTGTTGPQHSTEGHLFLLWL